MMRGMYEQNLREGMDLQDQMMGKTWDELKKQIRRDLSRNGTDVHQNKQDPYGDGDQSMVSASRAQVYRDLFATGADIHHIAESGCRHMSEFARECLVGNVPAVQKKLDEALSSAITEEGPPSEKLIQLLEKRETALRLSPLMIMASMAKNMSLPPAMVMKQQIQVAKLLLQYGARPDARDVCGKSVCHYGMGAMATDMTLQVGSLCIQAHQSSHFFGKRVELHGLKKEAMNGLQGYCKGYVTDIGRRMVHLIEKKGAVALKPENLRLVGEITAAVPTKLCDIPDRLGAVCLHEVLMSERKDVATVLLKQHEASLDVTDCDGISPRNMAMTGGAFSVVANMTNKAAAGQRRQERNLQSRTCSYCGKVGDETDLLICSRCQSVQYCSKECQKLHWKKGGHKAVCNQLSADKELGVAIPKPTGTRFASTINVHSRRPSAPTAEGVGYRKPYNVSIGEQFYIKVQGGSPQMPLLIYDKSRECQFDVQPGTPGFEELRKAVNAEPTWQGRKTFVTASFDAQGKCTVYPGITSIKTW
jgi:hypothetical protein